jgi:hypothetical protein
MVGRGRGRGRGRGQNTDLSELPTPPAAPAATTRGRGRGQNTDLSELPTPPAAPIVSATPAATTLVGATTTALHHPRRERRPPLRFRDDEADGEFFNIGEVSGDEEEEGNSAPTRVGTHADPTPLQTATDTARTDPLVTDGGTGRSRVAAVDVHELTTVSNGRRICKICE